MAPQTLQGADMLAAGLDAVVLVPDFFKGSPAKHEWVPPDTPEKQQLLAKFVQERADIPTCAKTLATIAKEAKTTYPSVQSWGSYGLCWGGKVGAIRDHTMLTYRSGRGAGIWRGYTACSIRSGPSGVSIQVMTYELN